MISASDRSLTSAVRLNLPEGAINRNDSVDRPKTPTRNQKMFGLADAFVGLPGGLGTIEELTGEATWGSWVFTASRW